jgi:hypothetical protein
MVARSLGKKNKMKVSFLQVRASKKKVMLPQSAIITAPYRNRFGRFALKPEGLTPVKAQRRGLQKNFVKSFLELRKARSKISKTLRKRVARSSVSLWASRRKTL